MGTTEHALRDAVRIMQSLSLDDGRDIEMVESFIERCAAAGLCPQPDRSSILPPGIRFGFADWDSDKKIQEQ